MSKFEAENTADDGEIVLVNVVHVNEGQQDAALDVLRKTVRYVADTYPGFRWSRLYRSIDGKTVINQALWTNQAEFESLFSDQSFLDRYSGLKETGVWEFHLYRVSDIIRPLDLSTEQPEKSSDAFNLA